MKRTTQSSKYPTCSVVVLNYNGSKVIKNTLNSLLKLNYPKNKFEVWIVDNNSQDNSQKIIKEFSKKHNNFHFIFSKDNLGFAGGNNLAIKKSRSKYIVLLNNDCIVDENWLLNLVKTAEKQHKVFSVGSKILLFPKFIRFSINGFEGKSSDISVKLTRSKLLSFYGLKENSIKHTYFSDRSISFDLFVYPNVSDEKNLEFKVILNSSDYNKNIFKLFIVGNSNNNKLEINPYLIKKHKGKTSLTFKINPKIIKAFLFDKIQNAGSFVFHDGYGRDIGAVVSYGEQDYEPDINQYNRDKEVFSTCGASCLYNREVLEKIGGLSESFFMYYEDTELSWRARNYGYKNYYSCQSVVRHLHGFSSKEWSEFFITQVEKSRLINLFFSTPSNVFYKELFKFASNSFYSLLKQRQSIKIKALFNLMTDYIALVREKQRLYSGIYQQRKHRIKKTYKEIISGRWLFD